jgi:O-antigen ligase
MSRKILYYIAFCLLAFTPFVYSNELYNGVISAKQIWFYAAMALLMLAAAIDMLFDKKELVIQFNTIDLALIAFYTYYLIRSATTPYMPLLHNQRFINWTLCVILYFILKKCFNNEKVISEGVKSEKVKQNETALPCLTINSFLLSLLILTALVQAIWGLLQLYGFLSSFNSNFKITGTFFNPAPYAMYLAVIFPLALGKVLSNQKQDYISEKHDLRNMDSSTLTHWRIGILLHFITKLSYYISTATVIAILLVLPATMIRAAWFGALAGSLVLLQYKYHYTQQIKKFLNNRVKRIAAVAFVVAVIASLGAGVYHLKKDSANGKLFIWEVTLGKIAEKPLFGYGIGRFEAEYNNWQAEYFMKHTEEMDGSKGWVAGNTKYCFNEFLEIAGETGIIGLFLFIYVILSVFVGLKQTTSFSNNHHETSWLSYQNVSSPNNFKASLSSIIIISALSFPFYNLPVLLLFVTLLAFISAGVKGVILPLNLKTPVKYVLPVLLLTGCIYIGKTLPRTCSAWRTWQEASILYEVVAYETSAAEYEKAYPLCQYNGTFLQMYGKCLAMGKDHIKAMVMLKQAGKIGGDYILYTTQGDVYKELKKYQQAEQIYMQATYMEPHKLYPHYLLAKLYEQTNDKTKAVEKAKDVLSRRAKVENMAYEEIKQDMQKIINENLPN